MKAERNFDIHVFKLSNGKHQYAFEIQEAFFELFDNEIVGQGDLVAEISLDKSERMIQMDVEIKGTVNLTCDRSLEPFDEEIYSEQSMIYKYGEEEQELSDDVMVIHKDTQLINIASILYEFIMLEIPMKKLHPKFRDEFDEDDESEVIPIYYSEEEDSEEEQTEEETIDPRWEKLKNLKK